MDHGDGAKVLDPLDKYGAIAEAPRPYDEDARARLLAKLDRAAERYGIVAAPRRDPGRRDRGADFGRYNFGGGQFGFGFAISP